MVSMKKHKTITMLPECYSTRVQLGTSRWPCKYKTSCVICTKMLLTKTLHQAWQVKQSIEMMMGGGWLTFDPTHHLLSFVFFRGRPCEYQTASFHLYKLLLTENSTQGWQMKTSIEMMLGGGWLNLNLTHHLSPFWFSTGRPCEYQTASFQNKYCQLTLKLRCFYIWFGKIILNNSLPYYITFDTVASWKRECFWSLTGDAVSFPWAVCNGLAQWHRLPTEHGANSDSRTRIHAVPWSYAVAEHDIVVESLEPDGALQSHPAMVPLAPINSFARCCLFAKQKAMRADLSKCEI